MPNVLSYFTNAVSERIRRSPFYYERYNNTCDFALNRNYERYARECKGAYEAEHGPLDLPPSPLFENAAELVRGAFPTEKASSYSAKITDLIERKDAKVKFSEQEGRSAYIQTPLQTLGADILDVLRFPRVSQGLLAFFRSNFRILWVTCFRSFPAQSGKAGSQLWHSDSFPPYTCKMFLHLTPATAETGATQFMNRQDTMAYRRAGYFGQYQGERFADMQDFARAHNLPYRPLFHSASPGDATIFDMNFFHRAVAPTASFRDVVQFCFVPSMTSWEEQLRRDGGIEGLSARGVSKLPRDPRQT
jgi:hypothetical protein